MAGACTHGWAPWCHHEETSGMPEAIFLNEDAPSKLVNIKTGLCMDSRRIPLTQTHTHTIQWRFLHTSISFISCWVEESFVTFTTHACTNTQMHTHTGSSLTFTLDDQYLASTFWSIVPLYQEQCASLNITPCAYDMAICRFQKATFRTVYCLFNATNNLI